MKIGISALAVKGHSGLSRLAVSATAALIEASNGNELHVYCRDKKAAALIRQALKPDLTCGCYYFHTPMLPSGNRLVMQEIDMPLRLRRFDLDAMLTLDFALPALKCSLAEFACFPDAIPLTHPATLSWRARWMYRRAIHNTVARGAKIFTISNNARDKLIELLPALETPPKVIYPALELSYSLPEPPPDSVSMPAEYLLMVGASDPRKNLPLVLKALGILRQQNEYTGGLVIVDSRLTDEALAELCPATIRGDVILLTDVTDEQLAWLYTHAIMLLMPSVEEGFGYPVLEALAAGTPALVSQDSAMVEIDATAVVETHLNTTDICATISQLLRQRVQFRQAARQFDKSRYSRRRLGSELLGWITNEVQ
jgi:glycosyltransferase involved in cell wall biosynthesis